jgi:hypothetical protein
MCARTDGGDPPLPVALRQKLSIVRALLITVKTLLMISLCYKYYLLCLFFSFKNAEMLGAMEI